MFSTGLPRRHSTGFEDRGCPGTTANFVCFGLHAKLKTAIYTEYHEQLPTCPRCIRQLLKTVDDQFL